MILHTVCFHLYLFLLIFCSHLAVCPNPNAANTNTPEGQLRGKSQRSPGNSKVNGGKKQRKTKNVDNTAIVRADSTAVVSSKPSTELVLAKQNTELSPASNNVEGLVNANTTGKNSSGGLVLDLTAEKIHKDLETSDSIPSVLKYSSKPNKSKITRLSGHGFTCDLNSSKVVESIYCAAPFDGNVTVNYTDSTYDQYILTQSSGFEKVKKDSDETIQANAPQAGGGYTGAIPITNQDNLPSIEYSQTDALPVVCSQPGDTPKSIAYNPPEKDGLTLVVEGNSDNRGIRKTNLNGINCYKAEKDESIISKIDIRKQERDLGNAYTDCIVCTLKENDEISILVAQKPSDGEWRSYTLVQKPNSMIRRDVTLKVKFDSIDVETIFGEPEPEDVRDEASECKILYNGSEAEFKSITVKEYELETKNTCGKKTKETIKFEEPFKIPQNMALKSLRSMASSNTCICGFRNGPVLLNEKYSLSEDQSGTLKKLFYGYGDFNFKISCEHFKTDVNKRPNVLFLDTITINASNAGLDVSHYAAFQVIEVKKRTVPTLVVLPNIEIFLDATVDHNLVVCNSGNSVNLALTTLVDGKSKHYLISNEVATTKHFSVKNVVCME